MPSHEDVPRNEVNSETTAERIRAMAPDLLLVSGAPILQETIWSIPSRATVNVHYGIAPNYRGEHTLFWPLYLRDYEHIGVTLHIVDHGIDTGRVLARGYPEIGKDDTEPSLYAKCAILASELTLELLEKTPGVLRGVPQESKGRLYLRKHRRLMVDAYYSLRRALGERPRVSERRIETYF